MSPPSLHLVALPASIAAAELVPAVSWDDGPDDPPKPKPRPRLRLVPDRDEHGPGCRLTSSGWCYSAAWLDDANVG